MTDSSHGSDSRSGPLVLITNDDGVASLGLHALTRAVVERGYEVIVAAPDTDMSGTGASIGRVHSDAHIDVAQVELPGLAGVEAYAVDGPPGLCVLASTLGAFGEVPDLVVSGINPGCNVGRSVLHSGTVGAVLSAANFGLSGVAVSIDVRARKEQERRAGRDAPAPTVGGRSQHNDQLCWDTAAELGARGLGWVTSQPTGTVLNINVPDLPLDELKGARWGRLAAVGTVRSAVVEPATNGGRLQMELRATGQDIPPDTDTGLVRAGYASITTLVGVRAAQPVDPDIVLAEPGSPVASGMGSGLGEPTRASGG